MTPNARRRALEAAAKVAGFALVGGFLACEKQTPFVNAATGPGTPATTTESVADASTTPVSSTPTGEATATATATASCSVGDEQHATTSELACCKELLKPAIAGGPLRGADHGACCGAVVYENEAKRPLTQSFPERDACCSLAWGKTGAFKWEHTYSCTPWGPPVPPEMDAVS
jgi:hypothetical protein